ncbi:hypothetical protein PMAYCL1PPCAC_32402, partial [Pristionchus mayeri]
GYALIFRYNLRVLENMKVKTTTNTYSVSRNYQIRENIALLRLFNKVALPLVLVTIPVFAFFLMYRLTPANIGLDQFRYLCIALADLWVSIACVVVISCIPYHERKIIRFLLRKPELEKSPSMQFVDLQVATDTHFFMLTKDWI